MVTFTDNSIMAFGLHKGKALANVPASYLLYLRNQPTWDRTSPLGRYIEDNLKVLETQKKNDDRNDSYLKR